MVLSLKSCHYTLVFGFERFVYKLFGATRKGVRQVVRMCSDKKGISVATGEGVQ